MSFLAELKRRHVFRVAAAYLVVGWLLTEVLTTVLPTLGAPEWLSRAIVLVFALGFLPTIVLAWMFEMTPEGIRTQRQVDRDGEPATRPGRRLETIIVAIVVTSVLFLGFFGSRYGLEDGVAPIGEKSIAVLPFVNMSGNPDNEYFSDGLTETLLHMLAQFPDLKVAARTSSFAFKNQNRPIGEIAAALGVAHVLEGSVQRAGDKVRITAQLIRALDEFHVWSASYDRTLDDIFAIQDEIAREVGNALSESILGTSDDELSADLTTDSTDAYDLYLQSLKERSTFSHWGLQAEQDLLKGALAVDPEFTAAQVALAFNYLRQAETDLMDEGVAIRQVLAIVGQVLDVRPDDVNARAIRLYTDHAMQSGKVTAEQLQAAVAELADLVAEHPDELDARLLLVRMHTILRQLDAAEALLQEALDADPLNAEILYQLAVLNVSREAWDEARALVNRSLAIEPRQPNGYMRLAMLSRIAGDAVGAVENVLRAIELDPTDHEISGSMAMFLYELGLIEEGDDFRKRVRSIAPTSNIAYQVEMLRALVTGDDELLMDTARQAIDEDINNRRNAYSDAVQQLLRAAIRRDTVGEELEYLRRASPGAFDTGARALSMKQRATQLAMLDGWYVALPRDELLQRVGQIEEAARALGLRLVDDAQLQVGILALRGQDAEATRIALERILGGSALTHLAWRRSLAQARYAGLRGDPRVRARLEAWDAEREKARDSVSAYLRALRG